MKYNTLKEMRTALENDPEIRIIGVTEKTEEIFEGHEYGRVNHKITFYVVLKQDTYDPELLNKWLLKYDPKRNLNFDVFKSSDEFLELTELYFVEVIGKVVVSKELKFTDRELVRKLDLKDGVKNFKSKHELQRGVIVRLFPNSHFAELAMKDPPCSSGGYVIPRKELRKPDGQFH